MNGRLPFDLANPSHVACFDELPLWSALAGALLLEHVPLGAKRALDLGSGAGFPLLELAERLGPDAHVVGLDPWEQGVQRAEAKRRIWGVPNASVVRADGAKLCLRGAAFDLVVSNLGVNNFEDPPATLRECHRVLRPGGDLLISSNVRGCFHEFYDVFEQVLAGRGDAAARERLRVHVAHRGCEDSLRALLEACGFRVRETHEALSSLRFQNARAMFTHHFMRMGFVDAWRAVAGEEAEVILEEIRVRLDALALDAGELRLTVPWIVLRARRAMD